jgi:hypothetical protein
VFSWSVSVYPTKSINGILYFLDKPDFFNVLFVFKEVSGNIKGKIIYQFIKPQKENEAISIKHIFSI